MIYLTEFLSEDEGDMPINVLTTGACFPSSSVALGTI